MNDAVIFNIGNTVRKIQNLMQSGDLMHTCQFTFSMAQELFINKNFYVELSILHHKFYR